MLPWQDFGSCICPVHTLRIPEPSPSSLMTLQVLHVPQGRWAERTTVGPHNSPSPKLLEVQTRLGGQWGVAEQCGSLLERSTALPVASAEVQAQQDRVLDTRHRRHRSRASPQLEQALAGVASCWLLTFLSLRSAWNPGEDLLTSYLLGQRERRCPVNLH